MTGHPIHARPTVHVRRFGTRWPIASPMELREVSCIIDARFTGDHARELSHGLEATSWWLEHILTIRARLADAGIDLDDLLTDLERDIEGP